MCGSWGKKSKSQGRRSQSGPQKDIPKIPLHGYDSAFNAILFNTVTRTERFDSNDKRHLRCRSRPFSEIAF